MSERSEMISKLRIDFGSRTSYIKAKLSVLVPSKIKALRLKSNMPRQRDLAVAAKMQQSRISMFETPGAANLTLETLAKLAAAFKVGVIVEFVPFSEMLRWENNFSQDDFDVTRIEDDIEFINPEATSAKPEERREATAASIPRIPPTVPFSRIPATYEIWISNALPQSKDVRFLWQIEASAEAQKGTHLVMGENPGTAKSINPPEMLESKLA